jgi:hypothetical protein
VCSSERVNSPPTHAREEVTFLQALLYQRRSGVRGDDSLGAADFGAASAPPPPCMCVGGMMGREGQKGELHCHTTKVKLSKR